MTTLLSVEAVSKRFRGLLAVDNVSFRVERGSIFAVIGPNGAGKTTLFNIIAGVFAPDRGSIAFAGDRIDGLAPDEICRRGIGRTFQLVRPFPALTVEDNVIIGAFLLTGLSESMQEILTALGLDAPGAKQVFYGLCLLVVVMALPDGVWPWLAGKLGVTARRS